MVEGRCLTATKRFWMSCAEESPRSKHGTLNFTVDPNDGEVPYGIKSAGICVLTYYALVVGSLAEAWY
ncbi:hypothetical protein N7523_007744 [Penicillium sp. IBT 18751x]|nr:hypothetical protein N7523_007744 [Penicillium sp. IBT 18751x]